MQTYSIQLNGSEKLEQIAQLIAVHAPDHKPANRFGHKTETYSWEMKGGWVKNSTIAALDEPSVLVLGVHNGIIISMTQHTNYSLEGAKPC